MSMHRVLNILIGNCEDNPVVRPRHKWQDIT